LKRFHRKIGIARTLAVVTVAVLVFPNIREFTSGLVPQIPQGFWWLTS